MTRNGTSIEIDPIPDWRSNLPARFVFADGESVTRLRNGEAYWTWRRIETMMLFTDFRRANVVHPWHGVAMVFPNHTVNEVRGIPQYFDAWRSWHPQRGDMPGYATLLWFPAAPGHWDCFGDPRGTAHLTVTVFTREYFASYGDDIMGAYRDLVLGQLGIPFGRRGSSLGAPWADLEQLFAGEHVSVPMVMGESSDAFADHVIVLKDHKGELRPRGFFLPRVYRPR